MKKLLFVVFVYLLVSCSKDNSVEPTDNLQLFPTDIGNEWSYYDFVNNIIVSYKTKILRDTVMFDNETWFIQLFPGGMACIIKNKSDGLYFLNEYGQPVLRYKYPAKANEFYLDDSGDTIKVLDIKAKVTVKAGTFTCYHYWNKSDNNDEYETYISPGVGMVKTMIYTANDGTINLRKLISSVELQSYNFKK